MGESCTALVVGTCTGTRASAEALSDAVAAAILHRGVESCAVGLWQRRDSQSRRITTVGMDQTDGFRARVVTAYDEFKPRGAVKRICKKWMRIY